MQFTLNIWLLIIGLCIYIIYIAGSVYVVLSENRNPIRALTWVIALIFLPVVGLVFYLFFGRSLKNKHLISRHNRRRILSKVKMRFPDLNETNLRGSQKQLVKLISNVGNAPLTFNNEIEIFTEGTSKFNRLKQDLRKAEKSIYLQYYIFSDDATGREIAEILKERASKGVDVKVIYDHVGSFGAKNRFFKDMREAGVQVHPFFRVTFPQLANRINWRNHRKLVIIDSRVGYIGGMNIADRYVAGLSDGESWRDTHFRVKGEVVEQLAYSFSLDWSFMNPSLAFVPEPPEKEERIRNQVGMQLITSGPVNTWDNIALAFQKAISGAKKSIYIQTPYFLPTDSLQHALEAAALSKLDVRVMIPMKSDSKLLRYATFSYVTQALKAGIKVYLYLPGMLHAKAMIIDDDTVTAGSANFDFRSFENNFEGNLVVYDKEFNSEMRDIFFEDMKLCRKLNYSEWKKRPLFQRGMESIVRLFSPIL